MDKKIYVILSRTNTFFSRAIHLYTKEPYSHTSIAFNENLQVMYSFGRKGRYNYLNNGFVRENFSKGVYNRFPNSNCCVIEIPVSDLEYAKIRRAVSDFCSNESDYSYNMVGVIGTAMGVKVERSGKFFCSEFVAYLLHDAGIWMKDPVLTKPMDFFELRDNKIVFEGDILQAQEAFIAKTS